MNRSHILAIDEVQVHEIIAYFGSLRTKRREEAIR